MNITDIAAQVADACAQLAADTDDERSFPTDAFQHIADAGLLAAPLSEELGGAGLKGSPATAQNQLDVLRELGRGNLSVGRVYEGHVNALMLVQTFGTPEHIARWAADARDRQMLFAVWNTEAGDGVRIEPLGNGRYRLTGAKTFASGAGQVQRPIITGRLPDGGWQMCIVPMDTVSTTIDESWWQPIGMRATASYKVDFTGIQLDASDLLGAPDDYHRQPWFGAGAIRFAAVQLGGAEALLDAITGYLRDLDRTGDPYQRQRIGQMAIAVEGGRRWLAAAARLDLGPDACACDAETTLAFANMTRLAIEDACLRVLDLAQRSAGARGLLRPSPIERLVRDLTFYLRQPAPDAALAAVGQAVLDSDGKASQRWSGIGR